MGGEGKGARLKQRHTLAGAHNFRWHDLRHLERLADLIQEPHELRLPRRTHPNFLPEFRRAELG